jgi:predicted HicB family RNase H-like nuclease
VLLLLTRQTQSDGIYTIPYQLYLKISTQARLRDKSLNQWVQETLEKAAL